MRHLFLLATSMLLLGTALCRPTVTDLGIPIRSMSIRGSLLVRDPVSGRPVFYSGMYTSTGTGKLIRFDYAENRVEYFELPGTKGAYGLCEGNDGKIYIGTIIPARLFSFDPVSREVVDLGSAAGEEYVFELTTGPDGRVYAATYPGAKVVLYDPAKGRIESLGRMHPTEQYCSSVAVADNGRVFAGIGTHADLIAYDPATGQKKAILPDQYKGDSFCDVGAEGDLVYAQTANVVLIIDANTYALVREVRHPSGGFVGFHRQMSGGPILINGLPGGNVRFNRSTGQLEPCFTPPYSSYDAKTGIAYGRTDGRQIFEAYNVTSGQLLSRVDVSKDGDGMEVFSLGTGPDGCIYGGVVSVLKLFKYDPATGILQDMGFPIVGQSGELYSLHAHKDKLYLASYSDAMLAVYDPSKPWSPGKTHDSNPRTIGPVGDEQNRPLALTSDAAGRIYIGTVPTYGKMGGALSIYDPQTDRFEVHRHIIPNQSIVSLTCGLDGWTIYGGSSISNGEGTTPVETRAHFFAWDAKEGKLILDITFPQGTSEIKSLATAPDGRIYGCAGSTLFIFDPAAGEIVHKQSAGAGEIRQMVAWTDGLIYGITDSAVFRMKPISKPGETVGFERLHTGGRNVALDSQGRIYFGKGPNLFMLSNLPGFEAPSADLVIYDDALAPGWTIQASRAEVDLFSTDMVSHGACQRISFDRFFTLEYVPPDPWAITLWEYDRLALSVNPGNGTLTDIQITKTGSGATESIRILRAYNITLAPGKWTDVEIPTSHFGWIFGARLESLKIIAQGSGTIYLDSITLRIVENVLTTGALIILLSLPPLAGRSFLRIGSGHRQRLFCRFSFADAKRKNSTSQGY